MNAQSQPAPAPGRPVGSLGARGRRRQMVAAYVAKLGAGVRSDPIVMADIERVVDLDLLCRETRAAVRQGKAKVSDLTALESTTDRAIRRLGIKPGSPDAAVPTLSQLWAEHEAEHGGEKP